MNAHSKLAVLGSLFCALSAPLFTVQAATTIDPAHPYAYSANLGWLDTRGDTNNGAVIGEYVCSGYIYGANVGWINLGSGAPANQIQYQNNSAADFGVNQDGLGNLRGYAWGANIGWVNFEATGAPRVDLLTGNLSGYAYSANCGWISLSNTAAFVRTATVPKGPLAANGLPVAWLLTNFGTTRVDSNADADGDGASNAQEYLAGTDPNNAASVLRITSFQRGVGGSPTRTAMTWTAVPSRQYAIELCAELETTPWLTHTLFPYLGANNAAWDDFDIQRFYRIRAFRPLTP